MNSLRQDMDTLNDSVNDLNVSLQKHKEQTTAELAHLQNIINSTQFSQNAQLKNQLDDLFSNLDTFNTSLSQHQQQTTAELAYLQTSLNSTQFSQSTQLNDQLDDLSSKLDTFNTSLSQQLQQTTTGLAHLQTSVNSTHSSHNTELNNKLDDLYSKVCGLHSEIGNLSFKLDSQERNLTRHQQQTTAELACLQTSLNSTHSSHNTELNNKLDDLYSEICGLHSEIGNLSFKLDSQERKLAQHQQQTAAELAHLQTSLNSINSKLDSLMATAAYLSSDIRNLQSNISDVQYMDTPQNLQGNLTHQTETPTCNVTLTPIEHSCGGTGEWRRVVYLDMTELHTICPSGWNMTGYSKRTCGRNHTGIRTCSSATFPVTGGEYSRVCGRIRAYQWGAINAFLNYDAGWVTTIEHDYAGCVSVTHGTPRNHIWTFVAGLSEGDPTSNGVCPCDATRTIRIPPFVGNDYFCESGVNELWSWNKHVKFHPSDTLWDGKDCRPSSTCCSQHNLPYFTKQLPTPTTNSIEARICLHNTLQYANLAVELVELYVQ